VPAMSVARLGTISINLSATLAPQRGFKHDVEQLRLGGYTSDALL
jgi:hypothetical protein